jgi:TM2 domain-containing membrane protein YozV
VGFATVPPPSIEYKSKIAAGLLGIFLGGLGIHRFYLGYNTIGLIMLLVTVLTCGLAGIVTGIWGMVEGIMILTGSINRDANGNPLRD